MWDAWFVDECSYRLAIVYKPEQAATYKDIATRSMRAAMATFSSSLPNQSTSNQPYTSILQARGEILDTCVRMEPPILPSTRQIDASLNKAMNHLWNCKEWNFRRQSAVGSIATTSVVTWTALSGTFDHLTTKALYYTGSDSGMAVSVRPDQMARLLAQPNVPAGRPSAFRMTRTGGTTAFQFYPTPDQAYSFRAEVALKTPTLESDVTDTWGSLLPAEFKPLVVRLATSDVLRSVGKRIEAEDLWRQANSEIDSFAAQYETLGTPSDDTGPGDHYGDVRFITGTPNMLGGAL